MQSRDNKDSKKGIFDMKKIKFFIMMVVLLMICGINSKNVFAAETISSASNYTLGTTQYGVITENGEEKQYYRLTLDSSGRIDISGTVYMEYVNLYLYDENGNELYHSTPSWNSTLELITIGEELYLTKGVYYFCIGKSWGCVGDYNFKIDFTSTNETFTELNGGSNNTINSANNVSIDGTQYTAQIAKNDEKDFFKMVLGDSGKVNFKATFNSMEGVYWKLYDGEGNELSSNVSSWNSTTEDITVDEDLHLTAGTYYLAISKYGVCYGRYNFTLLFTSAEESFRETNGGTNNSVREASLIKVDTSYAGQIAMNDEKDFYSFTLSSSKSLSINVTAGIEEVYVTLYDVNGNEIWSQNPSWNSTTEKIYFTKNTALSAGTYYLAVSRDWGYCGNYTLSVEGLTQSNCDHDFDNHYVDATYFDQGYRLYTCEICGYSYKDDYSSKRVLEQGYLYSYCSTGKGKMYLYWSTVSDATGYQIRYSKDKSFKTGVVTKNVSGQSSGSKTISKLSRKKKYYVQVRPYVKSGGKTAYGKWSAKKALKTK